MTVPEVLDLLALRRVRLARLYAIACERMLREALGALGLPVDDRGLAEAGARTDWTLDERALVELADLDHLSDEGVVRWFMDDGREDMRTTLRQLVGAERLPS